MAGCFTNKFLSVEAKIIYKKLFKKYGCQFWWPVIGDKKTAPFEISLGAILTQNTSWNNVEKTVSCLKKEKLLTPFAILRCSKSRLERCLKSSGYFRQKAKKVSIFSKWLINNYGGSLRRFFISKNLLALREELLGLWGIGKETADSILLYAGRKPIFVIDAYTKRLCRRYKKEFREYDDYRSFFENNFKKVPLNKKIKIFNEFHALIVRWGKDNKNV